MSGVLVSGGGGGGIEPGAMARLALVLQADVSSIYDGANAWRQMAQALDEVADDLTSRTVPSLASAYRAQSGGMAAAAFTALAKRVRKRATGMRVIADEMEASAEAVRAAQRDYEDIDRRYPVLADPVPPSGQDYSLAAENDYLRAVTAQRQSEQVRGREAQAAYQLMAQALRNSEMNIARQTVGDFEGGAHAGSRSDTDGGGLAAASANGGAVSTGSGAGYSAASGVGDVPARGAQVGEVRAPGVRPDVPAAVSDATADGDFHMGLPGAGLAPSGPAVPGGVPRVEDPAGSVGGAMPGIAGGAVGAVGGVVGSVRGGSWGGGPGRVTGGLFSRSLPGVVPGTSSGAVPGATSGTVPGATSAGRGASGTVGAGGVRPPGSPGVVAGAPMAPMSAAGGSGSPVQRYAPPRVTGLPVDSAAPSAGRAPMNPMPPGRTAPVGGVVGQPYPATAGGPSGTNNHLPGATGIGSTGGSSTAGASPATGTDLHGRRDHRPVSDSPWLEDESGVVPPVLGRPDYQPGDR